MQATMLTIREVLTSLKATLVYWAIVPLQHGKEVRDCVRGAISVLHMAEPLGWCDFLCSSIFHFHVGPVGVLWCRCAPVEVLVRNKSTCKLRCRSLLNRRANNFAFDSWLRASGSPFVVFFSKNGNAGRLCSRNDGDAIWARVFRYSRLFRAQIRLPDDLLSLFPPVVEISGSVLGVSNPPVHHVLELEGGRA